MFSLLKKLSSSTKWTTLFGLWVLHGIIAFWQFQVVSLHENSLPYFVVRAFLLVWVVINFILIILVYKNTSLWVKWRDMFVRSKTKDFSLIAASFFLFLRICLWIFHGLLIPPLSQQIGGYLDLLKPALNLVGYVFFEIVILISFINLHANLEYKRPLQKFVICAIVIFTILGVITFIVSTTGLGILSNYKGDWQRGLPAVPLLEWQILLACIFCFTMFFAELKKGIVDAAHIDLWICIAIWLGASILWLSQPVMPNALALKPREPNFEIYPFNDAQTYDEFAQSALVGNGFGVNRIPQRPLYIVFLIFSHILVGQEYNNVIAFQTLILAIFPVLLYLFGKDFFNRSIGISIALLAILRDYTSNLVSPFTGNISYTKLYLSEIPTAIFLILFLLVSIRWIRAGFPLFSGFLLGGLLGCAMLIRTQVIVALPVIVFFAFLQHRQIRPLIKNLFLMLTVIVLVVVPWLWRNWSLTGDLIFDSPESQTANLALRYSRLNGVEPDIMPHSGESNAEYNARLNQIAKEAITSNPLGAVWGITNAFLNHGVNNILLFPLRNDLSSINELWIPTHAFWEDWEGVPKFSQAVLIAFFIFVFGLGLTAAWVRNSWLGLLPLTLNLIYNLWTSLALLSGQRFMLTMDWSIYMYFMIGLFSLFGCLLFILDSGRTMIVEWIKSHPNVMTASVVPAVQWHKYAIFSLLFFGVGLSLPLSEKIFQDEYPLHSQNELVTELLTSVSLNQAGFTSVCFQKLVDSNSLNFKEGRAIYPRYYASGDGERFTDSVGYKVVDEGRLVFDIIGQANGRIVFQMSHSPKFFPHGADVTLVYDQSRDLLFVFVKQADAEMLYVSESFDPSLCNRE